MSTTWSCAMSGTGTPNRARLPTTMPAASSPSTDGCPSRTATSPPSFAATEHQREHQQHGRDGVRVTLRRPGEGGDEDEQAGRAAARAGSSRLTMAARLPVKRPPASRSVLRPAVVAIVWGGEHLRRAHGRRPEAA